jgi:fatty acid desaturase
MNSANTPVDPKILAKVVAPFESTEPIPGLIKYLSMAIPLFFAAWWLIFYSPDFSTLILLCIPFSIAFASLIITTHDAIHTTLTGIKAFDEIAPRLVSWPVYWIHSIYQEVHKLHHKMNGSNLSDPERVQYTVKEYENSSRPMKFFIRNQWFINLFVFTGLGSIYKTTYYGSKFFKSSKSMRRAFVMDAVGILVLNFIIVSLAIQADRLSFYAIWYLITQYFVGFVLQLRSHVEHYGLWGKGSNFYDTQVWNCRNMNVPSIVSWYFNYLSFHTIHHAFPRVPFYKLEKAQNEMKRVYEAHGIKFPESDLGYIRQSLSLARNPCLINDRGTENPQEVIPLTSLA